MFAHPLIRSACLALCLTTGFLQASDTQAAERRIHPAPAKRPDFKRETIIIRANDDGQHRMIVEVARTPDELAYGLMNLKKFPADSEGMLFISPRPQQQLFWMKNTLMPLDVLFLDAQGKILNIEANASPKSLDFIPSKGLAKGVLEIGGGLAKRWNIRVGDRVIHKDFDAPP